MLIKSTLLLSALAACASAVRIDLYEHANQKGKASTCDVEIDACYKISSDIYRLGLTSFGFKNYGIFKKSYNILLSAGDGSNCAGNYGSWGFINNAHDEKVPPV
ncbi:hypothetical protein BGW39_002390 [Mortierella sp. 14UC]|nr:hypothetical protein BGW39_002390 [Mortierella sp. 14UC]